MRGWRPEQIITAIGRGGCDDCEAIVVSCLWCRLWNWMCRTSSIFMVFVIEWGVLIVGCLADTKFFGSLSRGRHSYIWSWRHYCFLRYFTSLGWNGDVATRARLRLRVDQSELSAPPHNFDSVSKTATSTSTINHPALLGTNLTPRYCNSLGSEYLILTENTILGRTDYNGV